MKQLSAFFSIISSIVLFGVVVIVLFLNLPVLASIGTNFFIVIPLMIVGLISNISLLAGKKWYIAGIVVQLALSIYGYLIYSNPKSYDQVGGASHTDMINNTLLLSVLPLVLVLILVFVKWIQNTKKQPATT